MLADLKFALRQLVKSPGFTAVAVLSLALGIGANTTVFCWIQATLLRSIPGIERPEQMVVLVTTHGSAVWDTASLPDLRDYAKLDKIFAGIIASQVTPACLTVDGHAEWIYGQIATANFFSVLGVKPVAGRLFQPDEDRKPGGDAVLVLSEGFWRRRFGGDPGIVGKIVDLNRHSFMIVGVAAGDFHGTMGALKMDFWAPISMHREVANFGSLTHRSDRWLHTQARLQSGVNLPQAQVAVDALGASLEQAYPRENQEIRLRVLPVWRAPYGGQSMLLPVMRILMAVSVGVLLIVIANIANLLLARAAYRQKEIAIRQAMGVGRLRLIRQLLTESLLLASLGGIAGVCLASWIVNLVVALVPPTYLPLGYDFKIDGTTLFFTLLVTVTAGLIFGLAPALQAGRRNLVETLKDGGRGTSMPHLRLRSALVVGEIALALLLLIGAALCIKGFKQARQIDIGFKPDRVLVAGLRIGMNGYNVATGRAFYRQLEERLRAIPWVEEAALATWFPLGFEGGPNLPVDVEGYVRRPNEDTTIPYSIISPGYFATLRIPLVAGRDFNGHDDDKAAGVAIVNETMAKRFWPGQDPIGRKFRFWRGEVTVVGVVRSGKYRSLAESPRSFFYLAYQQGVWDLNLGVALRTRGNPAAFAGALVDTIHSIDPGVEVWASLPMNDFIQAAFVANYMAALLLTLLGLVAVALAAIGIYGVMAYVVTQRTQEIGIRVALGAQMMDVMRLVLGQGLRLAGWGTLFGVLGALAVTHLLASFLYGVSPYDPAIFGAVILALSAVSLLACWLPARRATKVDPMIALRAE